MEATRREFLQTVAGGMAAIVPGWDAVAQPAVPATSHHWGMVIDLRKCVGCQACSVACATENQTPLGSFRTTVGVYEVSTVSGARRVTLPRLCNHCDNPPCVQVCATQATYKRADGIVVVDNRVCIGCAYCVQACPYEARFANSETHTIDKCNFCLHRVEAGLLPACVETCVGGGRVFGDLNDPNSQIVRLLQSYPVQMLKPEMGTKPQVYYIGLPEYLSSKIEGTPVLVPAFERAETAV